MKTNVPDTFMDGLVYVAHEQGMEITTIRELEDGYVEIVFTDTDIEAEMSVDFRVAKENYQGRQLLEVRQFDKDNEVTTFFISPIPYVLFGCMFCET